MFLVYTKENCPYCTAAKKLLALEGQEYKETVIENDITKEDFLKKFPTIKSVPYILHIDDEVYLPIGGYHELLKFIAESKGLI